MPSRNSPHHMRVGSTSEDIDSLSTVLAPSQFPMIRIPCGICADVIGQRLPRVLSCHPGVLLHCAAWALKLRSIAVVTQSTYSLQVTCLITDVHIYEHTHSFSLSMELRQSLSYVYIELPSVSLLGGCCSAVSTDVKSRNKLQSHCENCGHLGGHEPVIATAVLILSESVSFLCSTNLKVHFDIARLLKGQKPR